MFSECYVCGWQVRNAVWCDNCGEPFHIGCLQSLDHMCNRDEIDQMARHVCRELDEEEKTEAQQKKEAIK